MGAPIKATRFGSELTSRPALTHHATDMMFNGNGFSPKQPSRTLSYPSTTGGSRQTSSQLSPASKRSSGVPSEKTITSPRRSGQSQARSPSNSRSPTEEDAGAQTESDNRPTRASSISYRFNPKNLLGRFKSQTPDASGTADDDQIQRPVPRQRRRRPSSLVCQQ